MKLYFINSCFFRSCIVSFVSFYMNFEIFSEAAVFFQYCASQTVSFSKKNSKVKTEKEYLFFFEFFEKKGQEKNEKFEKNVLVELMTIHSIFWRFLSYLINISSIYAMDVVIISFYLQQILKNAKPNVFHYLFYMKRFRFRTIQNVILASINFLIKYPQEGTFLLNLHFFVFFEKISKKPIISFVFFENKIHEKRTPSMCSLTFDPGPD